MDTSNFSPEAKEVIDWAIEEAKEFHHTEVGTHHFLIALVRAGALPADVEKARLAVRAATFELQARTEKPLSDMPMSFASNTMLQRAVTMAGGQPVTPHILAESLKRQSGHVVSVLQRLEIVLHNKPEK